jgi:hypothetical protein
MPEEFEVPGHRIARRGLIRRMALLGLGGAIVTGGLDSGLAGKAEAQGYMPVPPPRFEPPPPRPPGDRYIWEPGHWRWEGNRYAWRPGHYIVRGPNYAHFIPGHWAMRNGTWVWIPQHWN